MVFIDSFSKTPALIFDFINQTGLVEIFKNKNINNLVDYVFGIEVGLDTNARKNRGGKQMENVISKTFKEHQISFQTEVKHTHFKDLEILGKDIKRFDFVISTKKKNYLIETNYYNTGGAKLNEVARAYTNLAPKINESDTCEFVWITDGQGWLSAKNKLEEAYTNISKVYNLTTLIDFIEIIKKESE